MNRLLGRTGALIAAVASMTAIVSCGGATEVVCTAIGCFSGVLVEVSGATSDLTVEATSDDGEQRTETCVVSSDGRCFARFNGFTPDQVTIRVIGASQSFSVTVQPAYEVSQPNGPNCEPTCLRAEVSIQLEP